MASSLFEEALADAKKLREVAEQNAKNAIIEAVTPKIRSFIERQLIGEMADEIAKEDDDEDILADSALKESDAVDTNYSALVKKQELASGAADKSAPATKQEDTEEVVIDADGADLLSKLQVAAQDPKIRKSVEDLADALKAIKNEDVSIARQEKLRQIRTTAEGLYESIRESDMPKLDADVAIGHLRAVYESATDIYKNSGIQLLETRVGELKKFVDSARSLTESALNKNAKKSYIVSCMRMLSEAAAIYRGIGSLCEVNDAQGENIKSEIKSICKEIWIMSKKQGMLNEQDVQIKLGLPDELGDINVEDLSVQIVGAEEDELAGDDLGMGDMNDDGLDVTADTGADMGADPMGGGETADDEDDMMENAFRDDDVVEISESMLRRELARLREGNAPEAGGSATAPAVVSDFGGGKAEEEPFEDGEVTTEAVEALEAQLAEHKKAIMVLRKQLTETNLFNAKLLYANKVLQTNSLDSKQKLGIIESLDKAKTLREVKLLYKSLTESISKGTKGGLSESVAKKTVLGSASRTTKPASSLNESVETDRWAKLAGLI